MGVFKLAHEAVSCSPGLLREIGPLACLSSRFFMSRTCFGGGPSHLLTSVNILASSSQR